MKTKNDFIKLVEDRDLSLKNVYLLFGYKEAITKDEEFKIKIGNKIYSDIKTVTYLKRDSNMNHFVKLVALQDEYFRLCTETTQKPKKINKFLAFILLLLGIIPGIIYIAAKSKKKHKKELDKKRINEIIDEAKKLVKDDKNGKN